VYVKTYAGSVGVWAGVAALGILLLRGHIRASGLLALAGVLLCVAVANARLWLLPASFLLYPERVVYAATPLAAAALALAWRSLPPRLPAPTAFRTAFVAPLAVAAGAGTKHGSPRLGWRPGIPKSEWGALQWAAPHPEADHTLVESTYNAAGSYLPATAGVATTGWHMPL